MHRKIITYEDLNNSLFLTLWLYIRILVSKIPMLDMILNYQMKNINQT